MKALDIRNFLLFQRLMGEKYDCCFAQAAKECGLSRPEADILIFLYNNPECTTAKEISLYRGYSKAYVSKAVEALTQKQFLDLTINKQDRRSQHLAIKGVALPIADNLKQAQNTLFKQLMEGVTAEELAILNGVLLKIMGNMDKDYFDK